MFLSEVLFAVARTCGWVTQWKEMIEGYLYIFGRVKKRGVITYFIFIPTFLQEEEMGLRVGFCKGGDGVKSWGWLQK